MIIHGGYGVNSTEFFTDLWVFDFSSSRWFMLCAPHYNPKPVLNNTPTRRLTPSAAATASGTTAEGWSRPCWTTQAGARSSRSDIM